MRFMMVPIDEETKVRVQLSHVCSYGATAPGGRTEIMLTNGSLITTVTPEQIDATITRIKKDEDAKR